MLVQKNQNIDLNVYKVRMLHDLEKCITSEKCEEIITKIMDKIVDGETDISIVEFDKRLATCIYLWLKIVYTNIFYIKYQDNIISIKV